MSSQIPLVLLPGLDGTGALFDPLLRILPEEFAPQVVRYPSDQCLDYEALVEFVAPLLPRSGPYLLLGESFSGPVATILAHRAVHPPAGLVLACSFVSTPRPRWSRCMEWLPTLPALVNALPSWLLKKVAFGRWSQPALLDAMSDALAGLAPQVLHTRLLAVHRVDTRQALAACKMPVQYWQASEDQLVPPAALAAVQQAAPEVRPLRFEGPHALLQARPDRVIEALTSFAVELGLMAAALPLAASPFAARPAPAEPDPNVIEGELVQNFP
jgi:pimeloyl-ACP methyl ester carboxylesterase